MDKISDILKEKKADLQRILVDEQTNLAQSENTLNDVQARIDSLVLQIEKIDLYLEKGDELDTLFDNNN